MGQRLTSEAENVTRSVDITVVDRTANPALPLPYSKPNPAMYREAHRTRSSRVPFIYFFRPSPSPNGFVGELRFKHTKALVKAYACKRPGPIHELTRHIANIDAAVLLDQPGRRLVQIVGPCIFDFSMQLRHLFTLRQMTKFATLRLTSPSIPAGTFDAPYLG
jgi:hypothetical protein